MNAIKSVQYKITIKALYILKFLSQYLYLYNSKGVASNLFLLKLLSNSKTFQRSIIKKHNTLLTYPTTSNQIYHNWMDYRRAKRLKLCWFICHGKYPCEFQLRINLSKFFIKLLLNIK